MMRGCGRKKIVEGAAVVLLIFERCREHLARERGESRERGLVSRREDGRARPARHARRPDFACALESGRLGQVPCRFVRGRRCRAPPKAAPRPRPHRKSERDSGTAQAPTSIGQAHRYPGQAVMGLLKPTLLGQDAGAQSKRSAVCDPSRSRSMSAPASLAGLTEDCTPAAV